MTATNHTTNYNLSQFAGTDRPTWLGDYNGDMTKIDAQLKKNADAIASTAGGLKTVTHTTDLTGDGTAGAPLGVAATIARKTDIPDVKGFATISALTSGLAGKVDKKTASQPTTLGLTAAELDSMYKDADGIVRVGNARA